MTTLRNISSLIERQVPDFVKSDYPQFVTFIKYYYKWLEDPAGANTVYHIMNLEKYRDIDETLDYFVNLFKEQLLPNFPEKTSLDIKKILKRSREFYIQKGSEESLKWLFRVLFDEDVEIFYPKKQILKASDGKWKLPLAFRLTLSAENEDVDPNALEKLKGEGSLSTATCVIESANKTIDKNFGNEVLEIYVSGVTKEFENGEYLIIRGVTGYTEENPFKEKIIGSLSTIRVDSNINTDPQQKRRGLFYNVGDPVIVFGGYGAQKSAQFRDAVAYVEDVTTGSIEGLTATFPGYGYRLDPNTIVTVLRTLGVDDPNSNSSTSILLSSITTTNIAGNSQATFLENINVDKMPIEYMKSTGIGVSNYPLFTQNNRNIVLNVTENQNLTLYAGDYVYANGDSLSRANFVGRLLNTVSLTAGSPQDIILYSVANTKSLTTTGFLVGADKLFVPNAASVINVNSVVNSQISANANSKIIQTLNFERIETGGAELFRIINGGYGFRTIPKIVLSTFHDTYWSEAELVGSTRSDPDYRATVQSIDNYGQIAHVYINNPGTGYANGDQIIITGRGYGFVGNVVVGSGGAIVSTNITNRGEGYYDDKVVRVSSTLGANAVLTAYEFGEGLEYAIDTGAIGRVKTIKLTNRGFDYISAPSVSLKVMDFVVNLIPEVNRPKVTEGYFIYQGDINAPTFYSNIKSYTPSTGLLRTYNYSGNFDLYSEIKVGGDESLTLTPITITLNTTATVPVPAQYLPGSTLSNPFYYGNGKAKGIAEFFNGLIKFNGFYLNSDGFLSADKKTQDDKVYHNYSYVIQSEKSLADYESIIKDIVHPIGTSMLSKTITQKEVSEDVEAESFVYISPPPRVNSNVQISNSYSNTITGNNTIFTANLIGNLISVIDSSSPLRSFTKTITSQTSPTSISVEGNFIITGQGYINTSNNMSENANVIVSVTGRYQPLAGYVIVSDLNRRVQSSNTLLNGTVNVYSINTTVTGFSTDFVTNLTVGDIVNINNELKIVQTIAATNQITVNSSFAANGSSKKVYRLSSNLLNYSVNSIIFANGEERTVDEVVSPEKLIVNKVFSEKATSLHFKANTSNETRYVTRSSGNNLIGNISVNDIVTVNNEVRRVLLVTSTILETNAPFSYSSTAQTLYKIYDTDFNVTLNSNTVTDFMAIGDTIRFNISAYEEFARIAPSSTNLTMNIYSGNVYVTRGSAFTTSDYIKAGDVISINNQIRSVVSSNTLGFIANAAYTTSANQLYALKKINVIDANVVSISDAIINTNVSTISCNVESLVYFIVPNYKSKDYSYSFITLAE